MKTYTLQLTASQAEDLYFCVTCATTDALLSGDELEYRSLFQLREHLIEEGFSVVME